MVCLNIEIGDSENRIGGTTEYFYHNWQVLEERDGSGNLLKQYVYGNYIDEPWVLDDRSGGQTIADLNDGSGSDRLHYHCNTQYSVHALTNETGAIDEGYVYDAYGRQTVFTSNGSDGIWFTTDDTFAVNGDSKSSIGNEYMYTGRRWNPEIENYYFRNRYYDSVRGRFIGRDDKYYGRGYSLYASYFAINFNDPHGRKKETAELDCQEGCDGEGCTFELEVTAEQGDNDLLTGAKVCFSYDPPRDLPGFTPEENLCGPDECYGDVDRELGEGDHFTFVLDDGTECKIDRDSFPPNAFWPLDPSVPQACRDAFDEIETDITDQGKLGGGCYVLSASVRSLTADFGLVTQCGCSQHGMNEGEISIEATLPSNDTPEPSPDE